MSYLIEGTHEILLYNMPSLLNQMVKKKYGVHILHDRQWLSFPATTLPYVRAVNCVGYVNTINELTGSGNQ